MNASGTARKGPNRPTEALMKLGRIKASPKAPNRSEGQPGPFLAVQAAKTAATAALGRRREWPRLPFGSLLGSARPDWRVERH
jgi:hypothetical protein